jgi:excisionase family DNA binding protein
MLLFSISGKECTMDEKWYSVEQISEMLHFHPRTLRRYITEGRLRANKVGKEYRISGHDLSVFIEGHGLPALEGTEQQSEAEVSAVVDIAVKNKDEADRIERTLFAAMNSKDKSYGRSTANIQRSVGSEKLRVMLWGSIAFIMAILECISSLTDNREV